jgi:hypothetical protein
LLGTEPKELKNDSVDGVALAVALRLVLALKGDSSGRIVDTPYCSTVFPDPNKTMCRVIVVFAPPSTTR